MKLFSPKILMALIICENSCNSFKMWQCDWKHSNAHVTMSLFSFGLKFCTNLKKNECKENLNHFLFEKKIINFVKNWNHVAIFPTGFWFDNNFLNVYLGSYNMSSFNVRPLYPFGFLITNAMLKNEKEIITIFFTTTWWCTLK
jgi:hypothetical protein